MQTNICLIGFYMSLITRIAFLSTIVCVLSTSEYLHADALDVWLDSVYQMNEIVVVENRQKEIIPAQSIDEKKLKTLNAQSVADALRYFSGIQLKDFGGVGGIKTVNIRSMGTNHVGIFYDGIQLGNAQNGQIDLGRYSLDNIEEIQLYNGQKSNIFQSAKDFGSSGTIYIRTKRPRFQSGENHRLSAQFKTGSFGLVNPELVWEQRLSRYLTMSTSVGYTNANGRYKYRYKRLNIDNSIAYDTTATRQNGDIEALRAESSLFGFLPSGSWSAKVYFYNSERGIPGAIVNNVFLNGERQWDRNLFIQGAFDYLLGHDYEIKINAKYANDYTHFLRDDPQMLYVDNRYWQQEIYVSIAGLRRITSWWDFSIASDLQWNKLNASLPSFTYPHRFTEMVSMATAIKANGFNIQASILATLLQDRAGNDLSGGRKWSSRHEWTPALFFNWEPFHSNLWSINAFIKKSFRMPTFNDLYYTEIGNATLKPEYTYQYSIGTIRRWTWPNSILRHIAITGNAYFNKVTNKIIAYPSGQQFRWTMLNLGQVEILGAEISADASASICDVGIGLCLNYTYQKARDFTDRDDSYYGHQIPYIPRHSGSTTIQSNWKGWNLNYSFIYTGERYNSQENIPRNYEQPWYTHDASLYKEFSLYNISARMGLEVNNLLNQDYEVILNYPMPGRNYKLTIKLTI